MCHQQNIDNLALALKYEWGRFLAFTSVADKMLIQAQLAV